MIDVYPIEMTTSESGEEQKSHIPKENFEGKVPANRPGSERDIASAVIFVATNQYLNGQAVGVDGWYFLKAGRVCLNQRFLETVRFHEK
jgi:NAD(P)-dependent dehydrogenase (short-subunit alcohol dehydrogenase family)